MLKANETSENAAETPTEQATATATETPVEKSERPQDKGGVVQGFMAKDGTFHVKKADALKRNEALRSRGHRSARAMEALKKLTDAVTKAESRR